MLNTPPPRPDRESGATPAAWSALEAVPVFFIALVIAAVAGLGVRAITPRCAPVDIGVFVVQELAFFAVPVFWIRFVDRASLAPLGAPKEPLRDVGTGLGAGVGLYVAATALSIAIVELVALVIGHNPTAPRQVPDCVTGPWFATFAVLAIVLAPLGEETLFRGFLFKGLRRRFSFWPSALISGAAFGLIHYQNDLFLLIIPSLMVVGVGLAFVYERRQSLLASIAAHATFNAVGIALLAAARH